MNKNHDLNKIDGKYLDDYVLGYQMTGSKRAVNKIVKHFRLFRKPWANNFVKAGYSQCYGEQAYDRAIAKCARTWAGKEAHQDIYGGHVSKFNRFVVNSLLSKLNKKIDRKAGKKTDKWDSRLYQA